MLPYDKSLIIIPTYNEKDNIRNMIEALFQINPALSLLIIDDGSPDGTSLIVKEMQKSFNNLFLVERTGKQGLGTAYILGFKWALERKYDYIFEMDCDFSHDPKEIPNLLQAALEADVVIGSRYINGIRIVNWPMKRLLLSFFASFYIKLITSLPLHDATGGFKCLTRKSLLNLDLDKISSNGFAFQIELNYKVWVKGFKIQEVPIIFYERQLGQSKMHSGIVFEAFFLVIQLRVKNWLGTL